MEVSINSQNSWASHISSKTHTCSNPDPFHAPAHTLRELCVTMEFHRHQHQSIDNGSLGQSFGAELCFPQNVCVTTCVSLKMCITTVPTLSLKLVSWVPCKTAPLSVTCQSGGKAGTKVQQQYNVLNNFCKSSQHCSGVLLNVETFRQHAV